MSDDARPSYLIIEDNDAYARRLKRVLRKWGNATVVHSVRDAKLAIAARSWAALLIDIGLPDGSGLDVLEVLRALRPTTPALVLTGHREPAAINRACELGASYAVKPVSSSLIDAFVQSAASLRARLAFGADTWGQRYALSAAERDVLLRSALGESRERIAAARKCSTLTVKKQCAHILRKTGDATLHNAVARLMREIVGV